MQRPDVSQISQERQEAAWRADVAAKTEGILAIADMVAGIALVGALFPGVSVFVASGAMLFLFARSINNIDRRNKLQSSAIPDGEVNLFRSRAHKWVYEVTHNSSVVSRRSRHR